MELVNQLREEISKYNTKRGYLPMAVTVRLTEILSQLEAKIVDSEEYLDEVLQENQKLNEKLASKEGKTESGVMRDIQKFFNDEQNSDFAIKIGDKVFKVHKFVLAARSSVLAEMIQRNDAAQLDVLGIPKATFKIILDFIYFEKFPDESSNFEEIFMVSGRLNLKDLMAFSGRKVKVDDKNALEIFTLANKYNHEELKLKCFNTIQKMFPDHRLKPAFIHQPDMVKQFIAEKKSIDEMMAKLKQKFEMSVKIE